MFEWAALPGLGGGTAALRRASRFTWTHAFSRTQTSVFISERPLLARKAVIQQLSKSASQQVTSEEVRTVRPRS
jgi:hypothetical protein